MTFWLTTVNLRLLLILKTMENKKYFSLSEIAQMLGISRIAVFKKVKSGQIKTEKIGKAYAVSAEEVEQILGKKLTTTQKEVIDRGVRKTVKEYGEVLQMLGSQ